MFSKAAAAKRLLNQLSAVRPSKPHRQFSTSKPRSESSWSKYVRIWKDNPLPIGAGLAVVGLLQARRVMKREDRDDPIECQDFIDVDAAASTPLKPWQMTAYQNLPLNALSRLVGKIFNDVQLPVWSRKFVIGLYASTFGCNVQEAAITDLEQYPTLGSFFRRKLNHDARPIDSKALLTSPCDGRVLTCGSIDVEGQLEQIKGIKYDLKEFLGHEPSAKKLYQITMYLAPGDYHCFHSPANWKTSSRHHFSGKLLSVRPSVVGKVPNLFSLNERVVYAGEWDQGFFSFAAVGATNVGSIVIPVDSKLKTNVRGKKLGCDDVPFYGKFKKGEYFGEFNFGSTVVLVFEETENFRFKVKNGQKVKVGQPL